MRDIMIFMFAMIGLFSLIMLGTRFGLTEMLIAMGGMGAVGAMFMLIFGDYDDYTQV